MNKLSDFDVAMIWREILIRNCDLIETSQRHHVTIAEMRERLLQKRPARCGMNDWQVIYYDLEHELLTSQIYAGVPATQIAELLGIDVESVEFTMNMLAEDSRPFAN